MYKLDNVLYILVLIYSATMNPYYILEYSKDYSLINLVKVIIILAIYIFVICKLFNKKYTLLSLTLYLKVVSLLILSFISFYIMEEEKPTLKKIIALLIIIVGFLIFESV